MTSDQNPRYEEFKVSGDELLAKAKELVREGNVRRLIIRDETGRTVIEVPLTVGVVVAAIAAPFVAIGAIAALATRHTIVVERYPDAAPPGGGSAAEGGQPGPTDGPPVENG